MLCFLVAHLQALDAPLQDPDLDGALVCARVVDEQGNVLFDRNGTTKATPASNEKLLTAAFALYELGPDFKPETRIWKLQDRVVVESTGDPSMTHQQLANAASQLGLDRRLPVYVKEPYGSLIPDAWEIGDLPNRYAAPVAAFSVDQSGFELWNAHGRLLLRPEPYGVKLARSGPQTGSPAFSYDPLKRLVLYSGALDNKETRLDTLAVPSADEAAASLLGASLQRTETVPDRQPDLILRGKPLEQILADCLRPSDNNIAENLLLLGANHEGALPPNPYPLALTRLKSFLTRVVQIPPNQISPDDGSGLSRHNLATSAAIVSLLRWESSQTTWSQWRTALAAPGVGSLRNRLAGLDFHGKTGSMDHVDALSGYLTTKRGKRLILSVLLNNFTCSGQRASTLIDSFVKNVADTVG